MITGLRNDIVRSFEQARTQVGGPMDDGRVRAAMKWIEGFTRFLSPDPEIDERRRVAVTALDELLDRLGKEGPEGQGLARARETSLSALAAYEGAILLHGRANELADRVGLGVANRPI